MKKIIALLLCLLLVFSLFSCGNKKNDTKADTEDETATQETETTEDTSDTEEATETSTEEEPTETETDTTSEVTPSATEEPTANNNTGNGGGNTTWTPPTTTQTTTSTANNSSQSSGSSASSGNGQSQEPACTHPELYRCLENEVVATETSEGYTGDLVCGYCNKVLKKGEKTPKFVPTHTLTDPDGWSITYKKGEDLFLRTIKEANRTASHQFPTIEQEILRLVNVERQKAGLSQLTWCEETYYYAKIRADECRINFSHCRPVTSGSWETVFIPDHIFLGLHGENILEIVGNYGTDNATAKHAVDSWMNSQGHRENILNPDYKYLTVAVTEKDGYYEFVQHFFGHGVMN